MKTEQFSKILVYVLLLIFAASVASGQLGKRGNKPTKYPLSCAGIKVGVSTDAEVQRLYGEGYFVADEGHGGGRYYVDTKHYVTLHVEIGVDRIIDSLEYRKGISLPVKPTPEVWRKATSPKLTTNETVQKVFGLGTTPKALLRRYGKPQRDQTTGNQRIIEYRTDYRHASNVLSYEARFAFKNGHLTSVMLYNGE